MHQVVLASKQSVQTQQFGTLILPNCTVPRMREGLLPAHGTDHGGSAARHRNQAIDFRE